MKSVILICLLSLSVCFSVAAPSEASPSSQATPVTTPAAPHEAVKPKTTDKTAPAAVIPNETKVKNEAAVDNTTATNQALKPTETKSGPAATDKENKTDPKIAEEKPKPEEKTTEAPKAKVEPAPVTPETKVKNETTPEAKEGKAAVTTPKSDVVGTSEAPKVQAARSFDGASFIGGMILTLGLLAIGFMGFKYYKNQTERNYHTL